MRDLEKSLGKALTTKELAEYLNVNKKTIRENYRLSCDQTPDRLTALFNGL